MQLQFGNGEPFANGATPFSFLPATGSDSSQRIFVPVQIETLPTMAFIDTGGVYVICSPEIGRELSLNPGNGISALSMKTGRGNFQGELYRVQLTFLAEENGANLSIEATAFVPRPDQGWPNELQCILGFQGCLERIRCAVDPDTETFFFGDLN